MKNSLIALFFGLIVITPAPPQSLPADVILLSRVKRRVEEQLNRLLNVSCLETVYREHQARNGKMKRLDTVQLEVLTNGSKELYASPGDRKFSEDQPIRWVGSGAIGSGFFGLYLHTIFSGGNVTYVYKKEEEIAGRHLARWEYQVPLMSSGQTFTLKDGSGAVSLHGSFWADPKSADVLRVNVTAGDFPPTLPLTEAEWTIEYAPTRISEITVLLPQTADFHMARFSGEADRDRFNFTQCHTYGAETTLSFNTPDADAGPPAFAASSVDDTLRALPAGVTIPVNLTTRVSEETAVGSLVDGVVPSDVRLKSRILIPAGSPVRGRLRRLERYSEPKYYFTIAIEYTEMSVHGIRYRFDAELKRIDPAPGVEELLTHTSGLENTGVASPDTQGILTQDGTVRRESIRFTDLPGVATFFFIGSKLDLSAGLQTVWTTRGTSARASH